MVMKPGVASNILYSCTMDYLHIPTGGIYRYVSVCLSFDINQILIFKHCFPQLTLELENFQYPCLRIFHLINNLLSHPIPSLPRSPSMLSLYGPSDHLLQTSIQFTLIYTSVSFLETELSVGMEKWRLCLFIFIFLPWHMHNKSWLN